MVLFPWRLWEFSLFLFLFNSVLVVAFQVSLITNAILSRSWSIPLSADLLLLRTWTRVALICKLIPPVFMRNNAALFAFQMCLLFLSSTCCLTIFSVLNESSVISRYTLSFLFLAFIILACLVSCCESLVYSSIPTVCTSLLDLFFSLLPLLCSVLSVFAHSQHFWGSCDSIVV